jgi:hypothetical protein
LRTSHHAALTSNAGMAAPKATDDARDDQTAISRSPSTCHFSVAVKAKLAALVLIVVLFSCLPSGSLRPLRMSKTSSGEGRLYTRRSRLRIKGGQQRWLTFIRKRSAAACVSGCRLLVRLMTSTEGSFIFDSLPFHF